MKFNGTGQVCVALSLGLALTGCATIVTTVVEQGINVGRVISGDRSVFNVLDDKVIKNTISDALFDEAMSINVWIDVYQGRVMLTGFVGTDQEKQKAEGLARKVEGVRELYNEIKVTDKNWLKSVPKDKWIENTLAIRMVAARGISGVNYQVRVVNGVVYVLGITKSRMELNQVQELASKSGAHRMVSHLLLTEDMVFGTQPATPVLKVEEESPRVAVKWGRRGSGTCTDKKGTKVMGQSVSMTVCKK